MEIKNGKYDKGQASLSSMENDSFDFILAAGNDDTDEFVFKVLPDLAYTIRGWLSPLVAKYNVSDYSLLLELLNSFAE